MNGRLLAAYRRTEYRAAGAVVRVGRRSAAVDEWLRSLGARHGAFVTAWNPRSRPMPPGWNARMQERLRRAARRQQGVAGEGRWRGWAEGHLLLAGDPRRAAVLARRFRQNAIVVVTRGGPARLWWLAGITLPRTAGGPTAPAGAGWPRSAGTPGGPD